ncbi:pseudaminic acid cytidylyltransferase [Emticicia sp. BO119]|uniref:pseudaminic acid cytidylyltransferase n=1 Tax=Emticicia sp. BO119 TaxID=2757768 RepID=UPI0015F038FD|nr:pseudaminic acid cytidylyltransferase [Emticicia sp. BO119]MBA4853653.1 pseudaminic acid cytidylyltransferase [Emticicia sp. BO119]
MSKIAIIPARGGSKRIPRKNIKDFCGQPIIAYSIKAALDSQLFDEVMVSTDDGEIAELSTQYGASVPFFRSADNSNDFATTASVLHEVLDNYTLLNKNFQYGCCIYPTAPFVTAQKLKDASQLLVDKNFDTVLPIQSFSFPIQRAFYKENDKIRWVEPNHALTRSQDLPKTFHDVGQFYFFNIYTFLQTKQLLTANSGGIEISELEAQDIDNETDWKLAELKFRLMNP